MLEYKFNISKFFSDKLIEDDYVKEVVYDYYIKMYSADLLSNAVEDSTYIRNCECIEKNKKTAIAIVYYEAIMRAALLEADEDIITEMLDELENVINPETTMIRQKVIKIMKNTKKDKEQLNYQ